MKRLRALAFEGWNCSTDQEKKSHFQSQMDYIEQNRLIYKFDHFIRDYPLSDQSYWYFGGKKFGGLRGIGEDYAKKEAIVKQAAERLIVYVHMTKAISLADHNSYVKLQNKLLKFPILQEAYQLVTKDRYNASQALKIIDNEISKHYTNRWANSFEVGFFKLFLKFATQPEGSPDLLDFCDQVVHQAEFENQ